MGFFFRLVGQPMYERFTDRARKVMQLANQEAQRFGHEYIGTEHVLLGLVKEGSGVACKALTTLGLDLRKIRLEIEKIVQTGPGGDQVILGKLPHTSGVKEAIEYAIDEARALNHNYIGTEHLVLGLLRLAGGVASEVLKNLGVNVDDARKQVISLLAGNEPEPAPARFERRTEVASEAEVMRAARLFSESVAKLVAARAAVEQADQSLRDARTAYQKASNELNATHKALSDLAAGPIVPLASAASLTTDPSAKRGYEFL